MRRSLVAVVLLVTAGVLAGPGAPAGAAKGGWAVASFDPLPALVAGESVDVSFRLLQHGVHPVAAADWPGMRVHLDVVGPHGTTSVPAASAGAGRYTARVTVPEGSSVGLEVVWPNGLLLEANAIDVPVSTPAAPGTGPDWWPLGLGALAATAAAVVVLDLVRSRPRGASEPAPVTP